MTLGILDRDLDPRDFVDYADNGDDDADSEPYGTNENLHSREDKMRDTHFSDLMVADEPESENHGILPVDQDFEDLNDDGYIGYKREVQQELDRFQKIRYSWYRNGMLLDPKREHNYEIFPNGTLKIANSLHATGFYRCKAHGWFREHVAVVSKECHVRQASKFIKKQLEISSLCN